VGELQETMTLAEFDAWRARDRFHPISDHHRIYRPAAMAGSAFGRSFNDALEFLHPQPKQHQPLKLVQVIRAKV
jgi:hypothetical protein